MSLDIILLAKIRALEEKVNNGGEGGGFTVVDLDTIVDPTTETGQQLSEEDSLRLAAAFAKNMPCVIRGNWGSSESPKPFCSVAQIGLFGGLLPMYYFAIEADTGTPFFGVFEGTDGLWVFYNTSM